MTTKSFLFLRIKGYGKASCQGIADKMESQARVALSSPQMAVDEDYVVRWGCTATVPQIASEGVCVLNRPNAIREVSDKALFRKKLSDAGLAPRCWLYFEDFMYETGDLPVVVRPRKHKQGKDLHFCRTLLEVADACSLYTTYYISEYVPKVSEYRVLVVSGRVIFMYEKVPDDPSAIAWNHAQGSTSENTKWSLWPKEVYQNAVQAFSLSGLDFGAVDVVVDSTGRAYCLEINTAPETTSEYRQGCFAKAFDYIAKTGSDNDRIELGPDDTWKSYIHPCMTELAR